MSTIGILLVVMYVATILIQIIFISRDICEKHILDEVNIWTKIVLIIMYIFILVTSPAILCLQIGYIMYDKITKD